MLGISHTVLYVLLFIALYFEVFILLTYIENRNSIKEERENSDTEPNSFPMTSIIVPCWNEETTIVKTIDSLLALDYPKDKFEIIIVDNASTDKSKEIMENYQQKNKNIRNIFLDKNSGFSKGNNIGIKASRGKYVILLNNDCLVEKDWLKQLISTAKKDKKIFAVNPKVLLYPSYIYPKIKISPDFAVKDVSISNSSLLEYTDDKGALLDLIWPDDPNNRVFTLEVPFDKKIDKFITCKLNLLKFNFPKKSLPPLKRMNFSREIMKIYCSRSTKNAEVYKVTLKINIGLIAERNKYDKVQNAGIVVFQEGSGRDIGAIVRYQRQYYEFDKGQFDTEREIYAACAVATLYNREALDKIGYLDENFFMYYEDVEISERARLYGYKSFFNPRAIVRHLHALSSKEWSPFFIFNVEKGRYLHLLFYFPYPFHLFIIGFLRLFSNGIVRLILNFGRKKDRLYSLEYLRLTWYFATNSFRFTDVVIKKRLSTSRKRLIDNLKGITSGRWYFENR